MNATLPLPAATRNAAPFFKTHAANGYRAPAVKKAFQLLKAVAASRNGIGLSELSQTLGFSKSTTHGLIHALIHAGAVTHRAQGKKLCIGPAIPELVFMNWNVFHLQETAQPILDHLRDQIGETVILGGLTRYAGMIMAHAEGLGPMKISAPPGTEIPLLAGAVGKVFLSHFTADEALEIIGSHGLKPYTRRSIVDVSDFLAEIEQVRQRHYALDNEEYLPGIRAAAVSLGNHRGMILALWVVGFAPAMGNGQMQEIVRKLRLAAGDMKGQLQQAAAAAPSGGQ